MRRWLSVSARAASHVADQPRLWLPGALAWMVTVGWVALIVGVARPPTVAALTFLGAGIATSGAWPWNAVAILIGVAVLAVAAIALASVAEAALLHGGRIGAGVGRIFLAGAACVLPVGLAAAASLPALSFVAQREFNAPEAGAGPVLRTLLALWPLLAVIILAAVGGAATHAAAIRATTTHSTTGLRYAPSVLAAAGSGALIQAVAILIARVGYVALAGTLLRVLWGPIEARLAGGGFGVAVIGLLVGFVAIWLCLVLAGGALHAWGSVSWTRLLEPWGREAGAVAKMETSSRS
jgi:hypothetical protein